MSDIVERLATARNMMELERAAADAIAEIERLRQLLGKSEQLQAEIERLRGIINDVLTIADKWPGDPLRSIIEPVREALGE